MGCGRSQSLTALGTLTILGVGRSRIRVTPDRIRRRKRLRPESPVEGRSFVGASRLVDGALKAVLGLHGVTSPLQIPLTWALGARARRPTYAA